MGISTKPVLVTLPVSAKVFVPGLFRQFAGTEPACTIQNDFRQVSNRFHNS